jgi:hypothetical protein
LISKAVFVLFRFRSSIRGTLLLRETISRKLGTHVRIRFSFIASVGQSLHPVKRLNNDLATLLLVVGTRVQSVNASVPNLQVFLLPLRDNFRRGKDARIEVVLNFATLISAQVLR